MKVLMVGPHLSVKGGMSTVIKQILKQRGLVEFGYLGTYMDWPLPFNMIYFFFKYLLFISALKNYDIVHVHMSHYGSVLRKSVIMLTAILIKKRVVLHMHGGKFDTFDSSLPRLIKKKLNLIFNRCSHIIVLAEYWKAFIADSYSIAPRKLHVLNNPVFIPEKTSRPHCRKTVQFLFLGRMNRGKGVYDIIDSISLIPDDVKRALQFFLVGDGDIDAINMKIDTLQLDHIIHTMRWADEQKRNLLLSESDAVILPSYHECFPMTILEANAYGLPVIASNVGGVAEIIDHGYNGLLVSRGNLKELSEAIIQFVTNPDERLEMGRNARKNISRFNIKNYMNRLAQIYFS